MSLVSAKASLTEREIAMLESEMRGRSKSTMVAFVLWFFLGMLGGHRFYLNRRGWIYLLVFIVGIVTAVVLVGLVMLFILGIFVLVDAFRISGWVDATNRATESQVITEILASRAAAVPPVATEPATHGPREEGQETQ